MDSWKKLKLLANGLGAVILKERLGWLDSDSISPILWVDGKGFTGLRLFFSNDTGIGRPESCQLLICPELGRKPATITVRIPFEEVGPHEFTATFPSSICKGYVKADIKFADNNKAFTNQSSWVYTYEIKPLDGVTGSFEENSYQFLD